MSAATKIYQPQSNELSNVSIQLIHAGLIVPNEESMNKMNEEICKWRGKKKGTIAQIMAREIRKYRGVPDPDLI